MMHIDRKVKLTINQEELESYYEYYFNKYPRRRTKPIKNPIPPSLNQWMIMKRPQMNNEKQKWKEFIVWLVYKHNLQDKKIDNAEIIFTYYFPTKHRRDADNYTPKFAMDGLTESGLLVDDDFEHIKTLTICGGYDKENPRTEIIIKQD